MIWLGIGVAITAWLIGLLVEVGPAVHLLLVAALGLLLIQVRRDRRRGVVIATRDLSARSATMAYSRP